MQARYLIQSLIRAVMMFMLLLVPLSCQNQPVIVLNVSNLPADAHQLRLRSCINCPPGQNPPHMCPLGPDQLRPCWLGHDKILDLTHSLDVYLPDDASGTVVLNLDALDQNGCKVDVATPPLEMPVPGGLSQALVIEVADWTPVIPSQCTLTVVIAPGSGPTDNVQFLPDIDCGTGAQHQQCSHDFPSDSGAVSLMVGSDPTICSYATWSGAGCDPSPPLIKTCPPVPTCPIAVTSSQQITVSFMPAITVQIDNPLLDLNDIANVTISLAAPAPKDAMITLASTLPAIISVPASISVLAKNSVAQITITNMSYSGSLMPVTITATYDGQSGTGSLSVGHMSDPPPPNCGKKIGTCAAGWRCCNQMDETWTCGVCG